MIRWFLIAGLSIYSAVVSYEYWRAAPEGQHKVPAAARDAGAAPPIFHCPKCVCAKDEHQVAPGEGEEQEGDGS